MMMNFLRRLRRRWLGPTTREILWKIHVDLAQQRGNLTDVLKRVERAAALSDKNADAIARTEGKLFELLLKLNGEPFMALKKWLDVCTKSNNDHAEQRREFVERERELLTRWRKQVDQFDKLMNERYDREPVAGCSE